jgi:Spy/CpxP family protein refolding chaperone
MRRLNIAACSLMLLAAASAPAMAQGNAGGGMGGGMDPAQMVQRSTDRLMAGITLSATQSDSVKAINARFVTEAKAAMGGSDMRSKMTELRTKQRADIRALLTADQQAVFDKNVASMPARPTRPQP